MNEYKVSHDEFEYITELIMAVLFLAIGIVGTVFMIRQFNRQAEINPRVDKVRVSSIDQSDISPFVYSGYQAYMFAWMMDGHDKTSLYWFAPNTEISNPNDTKGEGFIGLEPAEYANGFLVIRNRAIIGAGEFEQYSVKKALWNAANSAEGNDTIVAQFYQNPNAVKLDLTASHVGYDTEEYWDDSQTNLFEVRRDYIWSLHPCSPE